VNCVNSRPKSVFKDQDAVKCLSSLHDKYDIVPVDKASNNIVFVCKSYYFECLIKDIQTRYCWKPCPQERYHICHEERKDT
jgi:hypothetical protein